MVYLKQRAEKLGPVGFAVFILAAGWLLIMIVLTPKQTIIGTWHDDEGHPETTQRVQVVFQANGVETQRLVTPHGLLEATANYTLDNGIVLKQAFKSVTLNGKPLSLPTPNPNTEYRCKVAGNILEFDSRALAVSIASEDYLPVNWAGKSIALCRDTRSK